MISVLYVDDEEGLLALTKRYLETKGDFTVDTAESGALALQKLKTVNYDAVVSDYQMPGMDGIEFLSLLRKEYPHLPFIIFTGKGREEVVIEAFEKGADFYLQKGGDTKPQYAELMHKIQSAVSQRHDEMALRESESRFRDLFNNMSSGVAIYEPVDDGSDFIFRDINHAVETIDHVRKEEIIGQSVLTAFPGIKEFGLFAVFQRVARTGTPESHPISIYKDNRISGWRENFVYKLPSGEIVTIYNDVTEKKQAEEAFSAAQVWLGIALRAAHAGIWDWDIPTGTLTWSPEFFNLFGLPPDATPSFETWLATLHPDDREPAMAKINQSVREHSFLWNEYRIILPGDVVRWIGAGGSATYNEAGEPLRMSGVCIDITDRKKAEVSLQESEEKFRAVLENIPDMVLVHRDGNIVYVNPALTEAMGSTPDEVLNTSIFDYIAPEYSEYVSASLRKRTTAGPPKPHEIEIISKTGERRNVIVRPTMIEFGGSPAILTVLTDITGRRRAEESLREAALRWQSTFDSTRDAICIVDPDQRIVISNRMMQEMVGAKNGDELAGRHCFEVVHGTTEPVPGCPFIEMLHSLQRERMEMKIGDRWIVVTTDPILDETQALVGAVHTIRDITYRKQTEEALRESEDKFRTLAESCPFAIAIYQGDYWIYTTPAGEQISGYTADELYTMHYWDFVAPEFQPFVKEAGRKRQTRESVSTSYDVPIITKDGSEKWVALFTSPITFRGKPAGLITVLDITERKRIDEALYQANKKLNLLSSITRHDILNGVAVLEGYIELAGDEVQSPGMKEYISHLEKAAKTIRHQIEFTKEYQEIGVKEAVWQNVRDTVKTAGSAFKLENVTLMINCENIEIFADPLLQKVFHNLFDNAFRYAPPFTTISISCTDAKEGLSVVFADDGIGITKEIREHLFERGFGNHTGLGLFLSREILAITGITITENGEPGNGARFEIRVPKGAYRVSGAGKN